MDRAAIVIKWWPPTLVQYVMGRNSIHEKASESRTSTLKLTFAQSRNCLFKLKKKAREPEVCAINTVPSFTVFKSDQYRANYMPVSVCVTPLSSRRQATVATFSLEKIYVISHGIDANNSRNHIKLYHSFRHVLPVVRWSRPNDWTDCI